ncbi:MAG: histidine phosphatase family protein, partial [Acidobacteriota bacterium]
FRLAATSWNGTSLVDLVLVRHGVTDWNEQRRLIGRVDLGLNERGRAQARSVAEALGVLPVAAVYSSPQLRSRQTAEPIARTHGLGVEVEARLDEVWLGRWQGRTVTELRGDPDLERYLKDPTCICDAIEPAAEVQERIVAVVEELQGRHGEEKLVLVSHADPLRLLLTHHLSMELGSFRRLAVGNGSVSLLRFTSRRVCLLALNWQAGAFLGVLRS